MTNPHEAPPPPAAVCSAAILASIFLLAARIISSRRFCSSVCLSSLLTLHFFLAAAAAASSSGDGCCIWSWRLYRWIRFGCAGFSTGLAEVDCVADVEAVLEPGGGGGWKVMGGCETHVSHISPCIPGS